MTLAPGTTAPVASVTLPTTSAVVTCASAEAGTTTYIRMLISIVMGAHCRENVIVRLLFECRSNRDCIVDVNHLFALIVRRENRTDEIRTAVTATRVRGVTEAEGQPPKVCGEPLQLQGRLLNLEIAVKVASDTVAAVIGAVKKLE